jgi:hypothetical protein
MSLLTDLINLNLSETTEKIIAEYIWSVSLALFCRHMLCFLHSVFWFCIVYVIAVNMVRFNRSSYRFLGSYVTLFPDFPTKGSFVRCRRFLPTRPPLFSSSNSTDTDQSVQVLSIPEPFDEHVFPHGWCGIHTYRTVLYTSSSKSVSFCSVSLTFFILITQNQQKALIFPDTFCLLTKFSPLILFFVCLFIYLFGFLIDCKNFMLCLCFLVMIQLFLLFRSGFVESAFTRCFCFFFLLLKIIIVTYLLILQYFIRNAFLHPLLSIYTPFLSLSSWNYKKTILT